jgi:GAF domain-containing protein
VPDSDQARDPHAPQRVDEVTRALAGLLDVLAAEEELSRVLKTSVDQVTRAIPHADMASVSVLRGDTAETVAASSERVCELDAEQYAAGNGPCLEAARTREIVRVSVAQGRRRWPEFARSARAAGVASYLSCPLIIGDTFVGSLNLYSTRSHGFGDLDEALLRLYVTAATAAIAGARRFAEARKLAENLGRALDSRAVIDQAIGVLMATRGMTAEQAFSDMARQSQNTNTKLRDVAARITDQARPRSR